MARLIKTPMSGWEKYNKSVIGTPESPYEATFDSTLERHWDSSQNWVLRITLRLFYRQINPSELTSEVYRSIATSLGVRVPAGVRPGMYPDADKTPMFISAWTSNEWNTFLGGVRTQAMMWDGKFWLIPPDSFSHFDRTEGSWTAKDGKVTYRPNVKCEFRFEVAMAPSVAHGSVDVVNLLGPASFRSHSRLYNNSDTTIKNFVSEDWLARNVNSSQPTITHEIGHSLGLPHVGVSRNLAQCNLAIAFGKGMPEAAIPALYKGSKNATVCYGDRSSPGDINNIMGSGSAFGPENAKPWLDRMVQHLNLSPQDHVRVLTDLGKWKVSLVDAPAMSLVGFK